MKFILALLLLCVTFSKLVVASHLVNHYIDCFIFRQVILYYYLWISLQDNKGGIAKYVFSKRYNFALEELKIGILKHIRLACGSFENDLSSWTSPTNTNLIVFWAILGTLECFPLHGILRKWYSSYCTLGWMKAAASGCRWHFTFWGPWRTLAHPHLLAEMYWHMLGMLVKQLDSSFHNVYQIITLCNLKILQMYLSVYLNKAEETNHIFEPHWSNSGFGAWLEKLLPYRAPQMIRTQAALGRHGEQSRTWGVGALAVWHLTQTQSEERLGSFLRACAVMLRDSWDPVEIWNPCLVGLALSRSAIECNCRGDGRANNWKAEAQEERAMLLLHELKLWGIMSMNLNSGGLCPKKLSTFTDKI